MFVYSDSAEVEVRHVMFQTGLNDEFPFGSISSTDRGRDRKADGETPAKLASLTEAQDRSTMRQDH
jgi:hypothetical protein